MSDDEQNGGWGANLGITLPNSTDAIYNAGLSPFFIARIGTREAHGFDYAIYDRGSASRFWSKTGNTTSIYILTTYTNAIAPSAMDARTAFYSLRCLVSTNSR